MKKKKNYHTKDKLKLYIAEANESFDSYLLGPIGTTCSQSTSLVVLPSPCGTSRVWQITFLILQKFVFNSFKKITMYFRRRRHFDGHTGNGPSKPTHPEPDYQRNRQVSHRLHFFQVNSIYCRRDVYLVRSGDPRVLRAYTNSKRFFFCFLSVVVSQGRSAPLALWGHNRQGVDDPQRRTTERVPPAHIESVSGVFAACLDQRTMGPDGHPVGPVVFVETLRRTLVASTYILGGARGRIRDFRAPEQSMFFSLNFTFAKYYRRRVERDE